MNLFLDLLLIAFIAVIVIDYSGFIDSMDDIIGKATGIKFFHIPKPLSCSFCSTFWAGIIYLLIVGHFNLLTIAYTLFLACLTPLINSSLHLFIDFLESVITGIYEYFNL